MSTRGQQNRKKARLADEVRRVIERLPNVVEVSITNTRLCEGSRRVKLPIRWEAGYPTGVVPFTVFDCENGKCDVRVETTKPGAIVRIVGKRLQEQGIHVC